jgi:HK97 family phage prohead protease
MNIKHMARPLAVKTLAVDGLFSGYASVFGKLDHQNEIVAPGAFRRTLSKWRTQESMPTMLWMHDPTLPIGVWLLLQEDKNGLAVQGRLALRTQKGQEAYELLKMKALTGLSIGYRIVSSRVDSKRKARVLTDVELFEISLVTFPANEAARVSDVKAPIIVPRGKPVVTTQAVVARLNRAARVLQERVH